MPTRCRHYARREGNYGKESRKYPRRGTPGCHGGGHDCRAGSCRRGVRGNRDAPGGGMPCLFRTLTGWQCPGCGMTHAVVALLRLDIRTAFACNALFPVYGAYCGWLTVSDRAAVYPCRESHASGTPGRGAYHTAGACTGLWRTAEYPLKRVSPRTTFPTAPGCGNASCILFCRSR